MVTALSPSMFAVEGMEMGGRLNGGRCALYLLNRAGGVVGVPWSDSNTVRVGWLGAVVCGAQRSTVRLGGLGVRPGVPNRSGRGAVVSAPRCQKQWATSPNGWTSAMLARKSGVRCATQASAVEVTGRFSRHRTERIAAAGCGWRSSSWTLFRTGA
jgi:hypothetical protein